MGGSLAEGWQWMGRPPPPHTTGTKEAESPSRHCLDRPMKKAIRPSTSKTDRPGLERYRRLTLEAEVKRIPSVTNMVQVVGGVAPFRLEGL